MRRTSIKVGVVYAVQVWNPTGGLDGRSRGAILPGIVVCQAPMSAHRDVDGYVLEATLRASRLRTFGVAVIGKHRADERLRYTEPIGGHSTDTSSIDTALLRGNVRPIIHSATTGAHAPDGIAFLDVEARDILGEWEPYWQAKRDAEQAAADAKVAVEAETQKVWDAAAAPLAALSQRLDSAGIRLVKPMSLTRDFWARGREKPADEVVLSAATMTRLLDALGPDFVLDEIATEADGWEWENPGGR